nr:MAG TPA: hypothetical protein [Caudoviricetes sp.]
MVEPLILRFAEKLFIRQNSKPYRHRRKII